MFISCAWSHDFRLARSGLHSFLWQSDFSQIFFDAELLLSDHLSKIIGCLQYLLLSNSFTGGNRILRLSKFRRNLVEAALLTLVLLVCLASQLRASFGLTGILLGD